MTAAKREKYQRNPMATEAPHRAPVDRVAVRVVSQGFAYVPAKQVTQVYSRTPLPTVPRPMNAPKLEGVRFGRFVVIGYSHGGGKKGAKWVVRCACGAYCIRRTNAITNPANGDTDRCEQCRHVAHLRRHRQFLAVGKNVDERAGWDE